MSRDCKDCHTWSRYCEDLERRAYERGYAACEADVVAWMDVDPDAYAEARDWSREIGEGLHRGAAARKDGEQ